MRRVTGSRGAERVAFGLAGESAMFPSWDIVMSWDREVRWGISVRTTGDRTGER